VEQPRASPASASECIVEHEHHAVEAAAHLLPPLRALQVVAPPQGRQLLTPRAVLVGRTQHVRQGRVTLRLVVGNINICLSPQGNLEGSHLRLCRSEHAALDSAKGLGSSVEWRLTHTGYSEGRLIIWDI
jgi:hypothetical protein